MNKIAVLTSGGLDSCVLLADLATTALAYPIYVSQGLVWEQEEQHALKEFIAKLNQPNIQPLTVLSIASKDLYGNHWSITGHGIPSKRDSDVKVFIPGRNVLLLSVSSVWCCLNNVPMIALGILKDNSFPDANMEIFTRLAQVYSDALNFSFKIIAPFCQNTQKEDLIRKYADLPLELSLTCMAAVSGKHCGQCNKCAERQEAFQKAQVPDSTQYGNSTSS